MNFDSLTKRKYEYLDDVETGMDNLDSKMSKTRKKFDNYVANSSSCCLNIFIVLSSEQEIMLLLSN